MKTHIFTFQTEYPLGPKQIEHLRKELLEATDGLDAKQWWGNWHLEPNRNIAPYLIYNLSDPE
jgi:hypothetical protein